MFSTHYHHPHQPSERQLRLLDLLARQAADLIENRRATQALRESQAKSEQELADATLLQSISTELVSQNDLQTL